MMLRLVALDLGAGVVSLRGGRSEGHEGHR